MEGIQHVVGEFVAYRSSGICRITAIEPSSFAGMPERDYYVLASVADPASVTYVPVGEPQAEEKMRHVLSAEEIGEAIERAENSGEVWIDDVRERALHYGELLKSEDRSKLLWLVKTLSFRKAECAGQRIKKKFCASDAHLLSAAEKLINDEFSFVLGIPKEKVTSYILNYVSESHS